MSTKVAIASDDGINVNIHFGWAKELLIYRVENDGTYEFIEDRAVPDIRETSGEKGAINKAFEESGCGCGNGHSCKDNFKHVNVDDLIESFKDCKYILSLKIGRMMDKLLRANGITAFSVDLTIDEALKSIAAYEGRMQKNVSVKKASDAE